MSPFLLLSLLLPLLALFFTYKILSSEKARLPPSPPKLPLIGNLHQLGTQPHRSLHALAKKHGPLMFLKLGAVPTIVVSSAEMAQEVMKTQDLIFASRPSLEFGRQLFYGSKNIGFLPYGEYWRQVKKITTLHLFSAKKVRSFRHVREEEVGLVIEKVKRESAKGPVNLSRLLNSLASDIVCRATLGRKYSGEEDNKKFLKMIDENIALGGAFHVRDFLPWLGWVSMLTGMDARMKRNFKKWDEFLSQVIADNLQRKSDTQHADDLVDILLSLSKDDSAGFTLNEDSVKAILEGGHSAAMTLASLEIQGLIHRGDQGAFGAGTDTSYITMQWAMAELIRSPQKMMKVQKEIRKIVSGKVAVEEDDISQMFYLRAIVKEVLRLHPPVPLLLPRESMEATNIHGYDIPAKSRVIINAWSIGRNHNSWDAPEEFRPEKFLDNHVDFRGHDFHYIPFGAGRRICPGISFAVSIIELALANLLYHFDWKLPDGKSPVQLDMVEEYGLTIHKKSDLILSAFPLRVHILS